ncbi:hypothetical protein CGC48_05435 [Capnocytophaga cynodegmi]|uniref:BT-3987-like N-terminal domain-containing protein n=1 Tax=Capnocytophaga cynodegmi TaxID=28189 RepID=A0A250E5G0_9FLAO|nr:DUF1735 domain-containing protein [Capnocytophaga cynodegmi]ATA68122.1 hypothetical protein CGC48_05435 [Capnocytophaga cynodegmi]
MKKIFLTLLSFTLLSACQDDLDPKFELPKPENSSAIFAEGTLINKENPKDKTSTFVKNGEYRFVADLGYSAREEGETILKKSDFEKIVSQYNSFKGVSDYLLLPEDHYEFTKGTFKKGDTSSEVVLKVKNYETLPQGDYFLPLTIEIDGKTLMHPVFVRKDAEYVALSETSKKPMPENNHNCNNRTEPIKMVAYVETNDWDIRNMGQFILKDSKKPVFDMVILFAANMNYDAKTGKRYLYFNDKLQPIVNDPDKYIKPLKDRGIKVLVDILPNHQGVGYYNFQNYEEALEFARECKRYADMLGIDGWDIDEEYAEYGKLQKEKPTKGNTSVLWFMRAMKEVMPDKLLTLYDFGHRLAPDEFDEKRKRAADYLDYSWANYAEDHGSFIGVPNEKYGKLSVEANWGLRSTGAYAQSNLRDCFGLFMVFSIKGSDIRSKYAERSLSEATKLFYGEECIFEGKYHNGPKDR